MVERQSLGVSQRHPSGRRGVVTATWCAAPAAHAVGNGDRVAPRVPPRTRVDADQLREAGAVPGLLELLAHDRPLGRLPDLDEPAGKGPRALEGGPTAAHQQHASSDDPDPVHGETRTPRTAWHALSTRDGWIRLLAGSSSDHVRRLSDGPEPVALVAGTGLDPRIRINTWH